MIFTLRLSALTAVASVVAATLLMATPAAAAPSFELESFESKIENQDGSPDLQAGSHPFQVTTRFELTDPHRHKSLPIPYGDLKDFRAALPPGLFGDPLAVPRCSAASFERGEGGVFSDGGCPVDTQVGVVAVESEVGDNFQTSSVYDVEPPPGQPAELGFRYAGAVPINIFFHLRGGEDNGLTAEVSNIPANDPIQLSSLTLWGVPAAASHDEERLGDDCDGTHHTCPSDAKPQAFITLPTSCGGPLSEEATADSWQDQGDFFAAAAEMPPIVGCNQLEFSPSLEARPTTDTADSPSGLDVDVHVPQNETEEGLQNPEGDATAQLREAKVTLPTGIAVNPSSANGLSACTAAQIGLRPVSDQRQRITIPRPAAAGFTLGLEGSSTGPLPAEASAAEVQAALEALPPLGAGNVEVTALRSGYNVEFVGALAGHPVPLLGGTASTDAARRITIPAGGTGSSLTLSFGGDTTPAIPFAAHESANEALPQVRADLEALPSIGAGNVEVATADVVGPEGIRTNPNEGRESITFLIAFRGPLAETTEALTGEGPGGPISATPQPAGSEALVVTTTQDPGATRFTPTAPECPDASKLGTVAVDTPVVDHPLPGAVYLAAPHENPFDSLLAIYIVVEDPATGVIVKLPGRVEANPQTGRLTTTVSESPQVPFEDFHLHFFKGANAPLRTPATCGAYETASVLTPWSAPESGPPATPGDTYAISQAPGGGACAHTPAEEPDKPSFEAGTETPTAGAYSPFVLHLRREDGSQELKGINATLPPGLTGKLAGVPECSEAALAAAAAKTGTEERQNPSCPATSQVGTVIVGAGAGPAPYYVQGKAYLAGPYKGAPLSLAIITPAVAGPFDLGDVVVRTALYVNPETAQITARSDPLPTILEGIPLDLRSIALKMDRSQFTLNPTDCEKMAVSAEALSALGGTAGLTDPFQVGGCNALGFSPKVAIKLTGATKRAGNPALRATLTYPTKGTYANIAKASVALPHSEFLDQGHIKTICTRAQFAEGATPGEKCPSASIYGYARAETPLLERPLEGPVYLRSSSNKLPDLVAALNGQIDVDLDGRIDSVHGGIRNSFEVLPDAPVSKFVLSMQGGKKGLLQNSTNLCSSTNKATVDLTAQNGKTDDFRPVVANSCKAKRHGKRHGKRR